MSYFVFLSHKYDKLRQTALLRIKSNMFSVKVSPFRSDQLTDELHKNFLWKKFETFSSKVLEACHNSWLSCSNSSVL